MIQKRIAILVDRPEVVDLRLRLSDWEDDTVYGQDD